nr:hypothetical protein [Abalone asfa-like virus]
MATLTFTPDDISYPELSNMVREDLGTNIITINNQEIELPRQCGNERNFIENLNVILEDSKCSYITLELIAVSQLYHFRNNSDESVILNFPTKNVQLLLFSQELSSNYIILGPRERSMAINASPTLGLVQYRISFGIGESPPQVLVPAGEYECGPYRNSDRAGTFKEITAKIKEDGVVNFTMEAYCALLKEWVSTMHYFNSDIFVHYRENAKIMTLPCTTDQKASELPDEEFN